MEEYSRPILGYIAMLPDGQERTYCKSCYNQQNTIVKVIRDKQNTKTLGKCSNCNQKLSE